MSWSDDWKVSRWLSQWVGLIIFERVGGRWMSRSETWKSVGTDSATFESQKVVPIDFVVYCSVKRVTSLHLNYFGGSSENWLIPLKKRRLYNHNYVIIYAVLLVIIEVLQSEPSTLRIAVQHKCENAATLLFQKGVEILPGCRFAPRAPPNYVPKY